MGEDLPCYSNKIQPVSLRECPYDHEPNDNLCLSNSGITNTSKTFTHKMAAKKGGIDMEQNYVTVTLCIVVCLLHL